MTLALCVYVFQIPSKDSFDTLSALDIAEQLTYLDHQIFIAIRSESVLQPQLSHWAHNSVMAYFCRNKTCFVATKVCLSQPNICQDRTVLSRQIFVMTNVSLQQKHKFVTTKLLSRQAYFCHNKRHVLSGQINTCFCRDKTFVATKTILVAAPTSDTNQRLLLTLSVFGSCEKWTLHHWLCCHIYYVYKSAFLLTLSVFGSCEKWTLHHWLCCHIYYMSVLISHQISRERERKGKKYTQKKH